MILNCIEYTGSSAKFVEDAITPFLNKGGLSLTTENGKVITSISELKAMFDSYDKEYSERYQYCLEQQSVGVEDEKLGLSYEIPADTRIQCINYANELYAAAIGSFVRDMFYIRKNKTWKTRMATQENNKDDKSVNLNPTAVMIHSPASCYNNAVDDICRSFNKESKEASTHFVIDGDTGYIYCTLPLRWKANHCGKSGFNANAIAIDIGEPSQLKLVKDGKKPFTDYATDQVRADAQKKAEKAAKGKSATEIEKIKSGILARLVGEKMNADKNNFASASGEGCTVYYVSKANENSAKNNTKAIEAAVELTAMICALYGINPERKKKGNVKSGKHAKFYNKQMPDAVVGHIEGFLFFDEAGLHGDPVNIWKILGNKYYKGDADTIEAFGLLQFRAEVAEKTKYYCDNPALIHPVLKFLWAQSLSKEPIT